MTTEFFTCAACSGDLRHPASRDCTNWWSHDDERPLSEREPWEQERVQKQQPKRSGLTTKDIVGIDFPEYAKEGSR